MKKIYTIFLVMVFIAGLAITMYPFISNAINTKKQNQVIDNYDNLVRKKDTKYIEDELAKAHRYNDLVATSGSFSSYIMENDADYNSVLNIGGDGVMGYVTIPRINVQIPIYHDTKESTLQVAAGHLKGSSLPVGGKSTHCVIAAHRGLPSANLFTNLDELKKGDLFWVSVLGKKITYEVDEISIVSPGDLDKLQIVEEQDYCTLMTCTPYGINTHRLLVRGKRIIEYDGNYEMDKTYMSDRVKLTTFIIAPFVIVMLIGMLVMKRMRKKKKGKRVENNED